MIFFFIKIIGYSFLRNIDHVKDCYKTILRVINADQPLNDIFNQAYSFATKKARSIAPRTPRIVILGPTGSGRKTVAKQVSQKYEIPISKIENINRKD